jgi:uncharacterized protein (DUF488 family)
MALSTNEGDFNTAASNDYDQVRKRQEAEIRSIVLTDEEIKEACYYKQRQKWYKERGINVNGHGDIKARDYWAKI